jgi:hypothetical protein
MPNSVLQTSAPNALRRIIAKRMFISEIGALSYQAIRLKVIKPHFQLSSRQCSMILATPTASVRSLDGKSLNLMISQLPSALPEML